MLSKRNYIIVILVAVVVRFVFMAWSWSGWYYQKPLSATLSAGYFNQGYGIAAGYGYNDYHSVAAREHVGELGEWIKREGGRAGPELVGQLPREGVYPCAVHPPGLPLLVAGINQVFGVRADVPIQLIAIVLDTIAAVIVCWLIATFLHPRVGFVTGVLYGVFPPLAYQAACAKMPASFLPVFIVSALACVLVGSNRKWRQAVGYYIAAGVLLGIGSYLRPDFVLLPIFLVVGLWAYTRHFFRSLSAMLLTQLVVILVLLPWAYRNHRVLGHWMFTTTGPGPVLVAGLGQFSNPWGFIHSDIDLHERAYAQGISYAWAPEADAFFKQLFLYSVKQDPMAWAGIVARRVPMALATPYYWGYDNPTRDLSFIPSNKQSEDRYQMVLRRPAHILAKFWDRGVMALVSLCCSVSVVVLLVKERHRWGLIVLLLSPHLFAVISHVLVMWGSKYVIPTVFCWLMAFAYVIMRGWRDHQPNLQPARE